VSEDADREMPMTSKLFVLGASVLSFTSSAVGWEPSSKLDSESLLVHYCELVMRIIQTKLVIPRGRPATRLVAASEYTCLYEQKNLVPPASFKPSNAAK
jgi:hypothetical protein